MFLSLAMYFSYSTYYVILCYCLFDCRNCLIYFMFSLHIMLFTKYLFIERWLFHNESEARGPSRIKQRIFCRLLSEGLGTYSFILTAMSINSIYFPIWLILLAGPSADFISVPATFLTCNIMAQVPKPAGTQASKEWKLLETLNYKIL